MMGLSTICRLRLMQYISVGSPTLMHKARHCKMRGSSSRKRKGGRGRLTRRVDATGGAPAMTPPELAGVVSRQKDSSAPHRRRGQEPAVCIIHQTAYNNATFAAGARAGSTSDDDLQPGPVIQINKVREVQIGPGITLGYLSVRDYRFITSLPVVEEQDEQQH